MDRRRLLWQMTAEQFAAFDMLLYLDTHPNDNKALQMFNNYMKNAEAYKKEYEALYGPISSDSGSSATSWDWIRDPWPWEKEAN